MTYMKSQMSSITPSELNMQKCIQRDITVNLLETRDKHTIQTQAKETTDYLKKTEEHLEMLKKFQLLLYYVQ